MYWGQFGTASFHSTPNWWDLLISSVEQLGLIRKLSDSLWHRDWRSLLTTTYSLNAGNVSKIRFLISLTYIVAFFIPPNSKLYSTLTKIKKLSTTNNLDERKWTYWQSPYVDGNYIRCYKTVPGSSPPPHRMSIKIYGIIKWRNTSISKEKWNTNGILVFIKRLVISSVYRKRNSWKKKTEKMKQEGVSNLYE